MTRRGVTLLELLIVLAILSILAGLTAGALIGARKNANAVQCASNLRQLGVGMHLYANDAQGIVLRAPGFLSSDRPSGPYDSTGRFHYASWASAYARYFDLPNAERVTGLFAFKLTRCPEHPLHNTETNFVVNSVSAEGVEPPGGKPVKFSKLSQIVKPADVIYLADATDRIPPPRGVLGLDYSPAIGSHIVYSWRHLPDGTHPTVAASRHGMGRINALFFDGHVDAVQTRGMTLAMWDDGIR